MEPTRLTVHAIMSPGRAAHLALGVASHYLFDREVPWLN